MSNWLAKARRLVVYFLTGILPFLAFFLGLVFIKDVNLSAVVAVVIAFIMVILSNLVSSTAWVKIVESDKMLCLNISSTGIIEPYLLDAEPPYAVGKLKGKVKRLFFDRIGAIYYLLNPRKAEVVEEKNEVVMRFDKTKYNSMRFDLSGVTTFIYNEQLDNFLTKDFFADKEQQLFLKNQAFSVHNQLESINNDLHYYASYVNEKLLKKKLLGIDPMWLIIGAMILVVVVFFGPQIVDLINSVIGKTSSSIGGATQPMTVVPK
jgi:hypothetical protein